MLDFIKKLIFGVDPSSPTGEINWADILAALQYAAYVGVAALLDHLIQTLTGVNTGNVVMMAIVAFLTLVRKWVKDYTNV